MISRLLSKSGKSFSLFSSDITDRLQVHVCIRSNDLRFMCNIVWVRFIYVYTLSVFYDYKYNTQRYSFTLFFVTF